MSRFGSSSIHGMLHFGRPATLAKPGSTWALPTSRLMQLIGMFFGRALSKRARSVWGPRTHPHVARVNGAFAFAAAATAVWRSASVAWISSSFALPHVHPSGVQSQ